jgi:hypothetical protein
VTSDSRWIVKFETLKWSFVLLYHYQPVTIAIRLKISENVSKFLHSHVPQYESSLYKSPTTLINNSFHENWNLHNRITAHDIKIHSAASAINSQACFGVKATMSVAFCEWGRQSTVLYLQVKVTNAQYPLQNFVNIINLWLRWNAFKKINKSLQ